jgi:sorbose reductase
LEHRSCKSSLLLATVICTGSPLIHLQAGKAIIVTGGNRGIGLAISRQVAQAGGHVAIVYHSSEDAPNEADKIAEEFNVKAKAYQVDTSDLKAMHELVHTVYTDLGPVGGLVANAGVVSETLS